MSAVENAFPTFFHINQGGDSGYRDLARLVAMSQPLVLWAPSSVLLRGPESAVAPKQFLDLLDAGQIRVMGRHNWIHDPNWRNSERWPGTAWDREIDGQIRAISDQDSHKPVAQRRVIVAPEEKGYDWADDYLSQHPDESSRWYKRTRRKDADRRIPGGTLESVRGLGANQLAVARRILRDAYNHGQALLESKARVPIMQSLTHRKFLDVLANAPAGKEQAPASKPQRSRVPKLDALAAMTAELVKLLAALDTDASSSSRRLRRFLRSSGHRELVLWMSGICDEYERHRPQVVDEILLDRLKQELGRAQVEDFTQLIRHRGDDVAVGAVALIATVVGATLPGAEPLTAVGALGLGATIYPVGKGLIREMGFIPARFTGPQWPFLYTHGRMARARQIKNIRAAVGRLAGRD